jgi:hypothetical protein
MSSRPRARRWPFAVVPLLLAAACTSSSADPGSAPTSGSAGKLSAEVASVDLVAAQPQRFLVGVFAGNGELLSFGDVDLRFSYLGTKDAPAAATAGPKATASYVPTYGTPAGAGRGPTLTAPAQGRGVYQAEGVTFDRAGIWRVDLSANVGATAPASASASFQVNDSPALPYPGQRAQPTQNLTIHTAHTPPGAIDSRAANGHPIPDPSLHEWTIAEAIHEHVPVLVTFATPVYCVSRFCGPTVDQVASLQKRFANRAAFIHVEIWRNYANNVVNKAAADWVYRDGDLTEPWTFLIASNGRILDRWGSLFDPREVSAELAKLPVLPRPTTG